MYGRTFPGIDERPTDCVQKRGETEGMSGQETFCLRGGLERVGRKWWEHGRSACEGTGSGGVGAALRKDRGKVKASGDESTAMGDLEKREVGVAGSQGLGVRFSMEYAWVSRVIVGRKGAPSRQPGQGTRWVER